MGIGEFGDNLSIFRDINVLGLCKQKIPSKVAFKFRRSNQHVLASPLAILFTFIISNRAKYAADSYKITRELPDNLMWGPTRVKVVDGFLWWSPLCYVHNTVYLYIIYALKSVV